MNDRLLLRDHLVDPSVDAVMRPAAAGGPVVPSAEVASDPKFRHYPEARFGGFTDVDQVIAFYTRVRALLDPSSVVLDIGCGRGKHVEDPIPMRRRLKVLNDACARVVGIDIDPAAAQNPFVDEFRLIERGPRWPVDDASVDLALSDYVVEHVADPPALFSEARRVIRPGGFLCMRTTNVRSYYGLASRLAPDIAHAAIIRRIYARPRAGGDVFRTKYRCNRIPDIRRMLDRNGFDHCVYGYQSEPAHFAFSPLLYALGVVHQRVAPSGAKPAIFVFAQRR